MVARTGPDIRGADIVGACLVYLAQGVAFNSPRVHARYGIIDLAKATRSRRSM